MPATIDRDPTQRIKILSDHATGKACVIAKIAMARLELLNRGKNGDGPALVEDLCSASGYSIDTIVDLHVACDRLIFACRRSDFPEIAPEELQGSDACNRRILEAAYSAYSSRSRENSYDFPVDLRTPRENMDSLREMELAAFCSLMTS